MRGLLSIVAVILMFVSTNLELKAQEERSLKIVGLVDRYMIPEPMVKVVLKNGSRSQNLYTDNKGEFRASLELNQTYTIIVEKSGYISKTITFETNIPEGVTGQWTTEFGVSLVRNCGNINTSVFDNPVDVIKYSENKKEFISDKSYVDKMRKEIKQVMFDLENCELKKYTDILDEADRLFLEENLKEAKVKYEEALVIVPYDKYPQRQLNTINKALGFDEQREQKYKNLVAEADQLMTQKSYTEAKGKYQEALRLNSKNNYPREKVAEIDQIFANQRAATEAERDKETQYNNLITSASSAMAAQQYEEARSYYEQALQLKPNEEFLQQKITELAPLIAQQQQQREKQVAANQVYQEAMAMGNAALQSNDYETAKQHFSRAMAINSTSHEPRKKIEEADRLIAQQAALQQQQAREQNERQFTEAVNKADQLFNAQQYKEAKTAYQQALILKPNESYATQRVQRINNLLASAAAEQQAELERAYADAMSQGDAQKLAKSYALAMQAYQRALELKPADQNAQARLTESRQLLEEEQRLMADQQSRQKKYNELIGLAYQFIVFFLTRLLIGH